MRFGAQVIDNASYSDHDARPYVHELGSHRMSLFENQEAENRRAAQPLAARMRPRNLAEFCGQQHILGEGCLLPRLIAADRLGSILLYGPPGTGKTTLANLLSGETKSRFVQLSAVTSGVKELRQALDEARDEISVTGQRTVLFVDEIHRFNKSQQDALLHDVEDGTVTLVGATTSNPFFAVNRALVSRSQVFEFQPLGESEIVDLLRAALRDRTRGLGNYRVDVAEQALEQIAQRCDGDARRALNALEIAVLSSREPVALTPELIAQSMQQKLVDYDATGDSHYDTISALIKSIRGSDPDAALYWLAKMLEAGEDVRFLCRRLVILASEDIGNASPQALNLAVSATHACEFVGLPECQLTLSQVVTFLACAPKSNAATRAISAARQDIREGRIVPVPKHLRDAHYDDAEKLGSGEGYQYAHDSPDGIVQQDYLGIDREYYQPVNRGYEATLKERLVEIRKRLKGEA